MHIIWEKISWQATFMKIVNRSEHGLPYNTAENVALRGKN